MKKHYNLRNGMPFLICKYVGVDLETDKHQTQADTNRYDSLCNLFSTAKSFSADL